jgi:hypothetical protein
MSFTGGLGTVSAVNGTGCARFIVSRFGSVLGFNTCSILALAA